MGDGVHNSVSGGESGTVVQAGQVHGDVHVHAPAPPARPVPRQLRPVPATFTDREAALQALDALLDGPPGETAPVVMISGTDGVGKRTVAAKWAHRNVGRYPDGQLVVRLRAGAPGGAAPVAEAARSLLRSLGLGDDSAALPWAEEELLGLWRSVAATRRLLVVLEDAADAGQVLPLVPAAAGCLLVVTSREPLTPLFAHGAAHQRLGPLPAVHGVQLLARIIGQDRTRRDPGAAAALVEACGGLPLAISLAAADLVLQPDRSLPRSRPLPPAPSRSDDPVHLAAAAAYARLPEDSARFLRLLGFVPAPDLDVAAGAAATGTTRQQAQYHLRELAARSLLDTAGRAPVRGDLYTMRHPVRTHVTGTSTTTAAQDAAHAVTGYLDHLVATARATAQLLTPHHRVLPRTYGRPSEPVRFTTRREALDWLEAIAPAVPPALAAGAALGLHQMVCVLASDLWPLLHYHRDSDLWISVYETGLRSATVWGDRMAIREMSSSLALGLVAAERHEEAVAHYRRAADIASADNDPGGIAQYSSGTGAALHDAERYAEADSFLAYAITLYRELGDHRGAGLAGILLGSATARQGNTTLGVALLHQARTDLTALQPPDPLNSARSLAYLGEAHSLDGRHDLAVTTLTQARHAFAAIGHRHWQARTTEFLGQDAERSGLPDAATAWYTASLTQYQALRSSRDTNRLEHHLRRVQP
ncbi:hypothetical protein [Kitasatospora sp. NPDC087315]|uniref:hypothetical protein n=1 Tax=Kitasatospora sp. NPDC087315 TaxID=3364069 RepID=UPI003808B151